jgi:hypothetical protein
MKLTNYNKGYREKFDCSIHGTLEVNKEEFKKILPIIKKYCIDYDNAIQKNYYVDKQGNHYYSFGITPFIKIVNKYQLKNCKDGNYQIKLAI